MDQKTAPLQELSAHPGPAGVHRAHSSCSGYFAGLFDIDPQPLELPLAIVTLLLVLAVLGFAGKC